jgi:calcium binding protein
VFGSSFRCSSGDLVVKPRRDRKRERRITMEIVVDAYDTHERAMGWYYYLQEQLNFPFAATCIAKRAISPLRVKDKVQVIGMPGEDQCEHEMFVTIRWEKDGLAVPLAQLRPIKATHTRTKQGAEDWHYWVKMGYEL